MATDSKLTALTELTAPASTDILYMADDPAGSPVSKKITCANLSKAIDHGTLAGLSDDDHSQYALLAGRNGGQTLIGDIATGGDLTLQSTVHATRGKILFGTSCYDEANNRLGIGTTTPGTLLSLEKTAAGAASSMLFELINPYSHSGSIRHYTYPDAGGGAIVFHGTPTFTSNEITGLSSDYPTAARGTVALESTSGKFKIHFHDGSNYIGSMLDISKEGLVVFNEAGLDKDFRIETDAEANAFFIDAGNNNTTINGASVSAHYDLGLVGDGILLLKEGATPTADANFGKIYCKNDNILYFQDGAGAEHTVAFV